jgi:hypothetical protein
MIFWPPALFLYARSMGRWEAIFCALAGVFPCLNLAVLLGLNRQARKICGGAGWEVGIVDEPRSHHETRASTTGAVVMAFFLALTMLWTLILAWPQLTAPKPTRGTAPQRSGLGDERWNRPGVDGPR